MRQNPQNVSPMSNEGRNAYVIEHLTNAMLKLLRDKPLGEISISELIEEAGVGRASFYRNFEDKADILKAYLNKIFHEWVDEYEKSPERPLSEQLRTLFAHFEKYRDFYTLLNDRGLLWLLKDVVVWIFGPKPEHSQVEAYSRAYAAYVLYGWIEVWFQRGMQESAEEIAALFKSQGF
ncbi:TetR/AcrR family transcriptional regulator [Lachnotalea sp. AF33-28]|uniref:TetR/AcrR family transcriptional regulator n=1 Tax=Lachnotalea sp. AF33-28 TaxID=2292046 RepID=UPI000E515290|nr:TetR/AcrR family transcriptional regulator [Lachnotalea sp. AF33-28]RHP34517.1 TetR/AcrR family transcriptional regulator [Lachnotalea sp. AF33-28]